MTRLPLLPLPAAVPGTLPRRQSFSSKIATLTPERQHQRLGAKFERLDRLLQHDVLALRDDPGGIAPERALVLEVAGSMDDFASLVKHVDGMEFLREEEIEVESDEDFFEIDQRKGRKGEPRRDRKLGGRLYLTMPDTTALKQLVSLWNRWQHGEKLPLGSTKWCNVFAMLHEIRPWGVKDRVSEDTMAYWREQLEADPNVNRRIEVEMWFRETPTDRAAALGRIRKAAAEAGGAEIHHSTVEEIGYEALLVDLPGSEIARLVEHEEAHMVICDDVMFLRPQSSVDLPRPNEEMAPEPATSDDKLPTLPPIAALLDGVPVQNHALLHGRLDLDDPDDLEAMSVLGERHHGTAMASLIVHGDRNLPGHALPRRLHARPILPARDRLFVDVMYRAVRRIKEGDEEGNATGPEVFLVNLSIGDPRRPFAGPMSPLARLLDYLADRYGILFLVSAGNISMPLRMDEFEDWFAFEQADPKEREEAVLEAVSNEKAMRTLLSPAEALNPITVGARHEDGAIGPRSAGAVDPFTGNDLPNVSSAFGLGHRKAVKPEILLPGGREHLHMKTTGGGGPLVVTPEPGGSGLRAAAPDMTGKRNRTQLVPGSSAATALATRAAHRIHDVLMDRSAGSAHADMPPQFRGVVVKALLVHRAKWVDRAALLLAELLGPHDLGKHTERKDNVARMLGYGFPDIQESMYCAPNRATLVGYGTISSGKVNKHRIPLPPRLEGVAEPRSLIFTVAWFSPINRRHRAYRKAKLEVTPIEPEIAFGVKRRKEQPPAVSSQRGTLWHAWYEGRRAAPFVDDGHVAFRISCREQAGKLDKEIPYGIACTLKAGSGIPVYDEVRARLAVPVMPQTP